MITMCGKDTIANKKEKIIETELHFMALKLKFKKSCIFQKILEFRIKRHISTKY